MANNAARSSNISRKTKETDIQIHLSLDGNGTNNIATGVPFMDHMLTLLAIHGFFDLSVKAVGDTDIDGHHTVEDLGISLGQAFNEVLGDNSFINRYGSSSVPMDETLVRVDLDFSNRPFLHYDALIPAAQVGTFDTELVKEFLRAFSLHGGITLHVEMVRGENSHHIIEAIFKALGRALANAVKINPALEGPLSSKGSI